jgi:radical SAM protein with 4Fe4S-binding SPASM domain
VKPISAVVAVTARCNARCVMCDMWKQGDGQEMPAEEYRRLPSSLRDINVSGGEPFLRHDLVEVAAAMHEACPQARIVISSNGLGVDVIRRTAPGLVELNIPLAVRISIDGLEETHDRLRGVPQGFSRATQALEILREAGIRDLGIGMTLVEDNLAEVGCVYRLANGWGVEFSLTLATGSPIYFGQDKSRLRPRDSHELYNHLGALVASEYRRWQPKRWLRAWFDKGLLQYAVKGRRALPCDAGQGFFYLDPHGEVYCCHLLSHRLGNLRASDWESIWVSATAQEVRREIAECQGCWMVCTARTQMRKNMVRVGRDILCDKFRAHARGVIVQETEHDRRA